MSNLRLAFLVAFAVAAFAAATYASDFLGVSSTLSDVISALFTLGGVVALFAMVGVVMSKRETLL